MVSVAAHRRPSLGWAWTFGLVGVGAVAVLNVAVLPPLLGGGAGDGSLAEPEGASGSSRVARSGQRDTVGAVVAAAPAVTSPSTADQAAPPQPTGDVDTLAPALAVADAGAADDTAGIETEPSTAEPNAIEVAAEPSATEVAVEPSAAEPNAIEVAAGPSVAEPSATEPSAIAVAAEPSAAEPSAIEVAAEPSAIEVAAEPSATEVAAEPSATEPSATEVAAGPSAIDAAAEPSAAVAPGAAPEPGETTPVPAPTAPAPSELELHFALDAYELTERHEAALAPVVARLRADSGCAVVVDCHADRFGDERFNEVLTRRRCRSVAAYIEASGVGAGRVRTRAHGERDTPGRDGELDPGARLARVVSVCGARTPAGVPGDTEEERHGDHPVR